MKRVILLIMLYLLNSCGPDGVVGGLPDRVVDGVINKSRGLNLKSSKPQESQTPKGPLKKRIDDKTLLSWIGKVPQQETTWGCGNVSCGYAIVASGKNRFDPNVLKEYPVSVHAVFAKDVKPEIEKLIPSLKLQTEVDKRGNEHFIVGAMPHSLPEYLAHHGAKGAHHIALDSLSKQDFIDEVLANVNKNRPLIVMQVVNPNEFTLHYLSVVGISNDFSKVLLLDTTGEAQKRLRWEDVDNFMKSLNARSFKSNLNAMLPVLIGLLPLSETLGIKVVKLIDPKELNRLGNFNLISFSDR
ncbi:MAG: hypothetical protein KC505_07115 [Myxococcales bacterium]|nr:hypothetical protein [Myxococcales bacterium]USN50621.1 MAG: hypothetical protein H6731_10220 [Myxococcales bacterium]